LTRSLVGWESMSATQVFISTKRLVCDFHLRAFFVYRARDHHHHNNHNQCGWTDSIISKGPFCLSASVRNWHSLVTRLVWNLLCILVCTQSVLDVICNGPGRIRRANATPWSIPSCSLLWISSRQSIGELLSVPRTLELHNTSDLAVSSTSASPLEWRTSYFALATS